MLISKRILIEVVERETFYIEMFQYRAKLQASLWFRARDFL